MGEGHMCGRSCNWSHRRSTPRGDVNDYFFDGLNGQHRFDRCDVSVVSCVYDTSLKKLLSF
jgi:hypothetical protein